MMTCSTCCTLIKVQIPGPSFVYSAQLFDDASWQELRSRLVYFYTTSASSAAPFQLITIFLNLDDWLHKAWSWHALTVFSCSEVNSACWMSVSWPPDPTARVLATKSIKKLKDSLRLQFLLYVSSSGLHTRAPISKPLKKKCYLWLEYIALLFVHISEILTRMKYMHIFINISLS